MHKLESVSFKTVRHILMLPFVLLKRTGSEEEFINDIVSASRRHAYGPLAERLIHMEHKSGNTSGISKSSPDG